RTGEARRADGAAAAAISSFSARQRSPHCLLVKEHRVREGPGDTHPPQRTLFVLNVPPYCSPVTVLLLWGRAVCGPP
uniref:Uncharacterized protein n=1 Tax=Meleagris gallopavo TaxID=9103 RepID=G1NHC6_MELGA